MAQSASTNLVRGKLMRLSRSYAIFLRQWYLIRGNPTRLVSIFLWILIDIIQWGFISRYLGTLGQATFSFITVILGAIILWEFMSRIQQGIMMAFMEDVWAQNFINFFASPLKIGEYLTGLVATSIVASLVGFATMVLLAGLAFGYNVFQVGLMIIPFILILFVFGVAMGIFISAVILRMGPSAEWIAWPIPLIMSIFSGVFYPIATLPVALQAVAKLLPPAYVFESLRSLLATGNFPLHNLVLGLGLSLVYLLIMYKLFIKTYKRSLEAGSLARFSAESV